MTFEQAAYSVGWGELVNFSKHLPASSATMRAKNEDMAVWDSNIKQSMILADIFDAIRMFNFSFAKHGEKEPKPYTRPWAKESAKRIGSAPIPIEEFNDWYYRGDS